MLKLNSINKAFKHQTVLNDINLEIKEGELIHISGINGSGKNPTQNYIRSYQT